LTRPAEFKRVFDSAKTSGDRAFRVLARTGTAGLTRLGMAVSRQIDRKASGRNRIKRVVRESFRRHFGPGGPLDSTVPLDIVVLPRQGCASISNAELAASLDNHWKRIVAQFEPREAPPA
jgi:ribonuclease P protein component